MPHPRVKYAVRYPAGDGRYRYQSVEMASPGGSTFVPLEHLPAVGDTVSRWDSQLHRQNLPQPEGGPVFAVVARHWGYVSWGSATWPYGEREPREGPLVDIIVEPAEGPYAHETDICGESTCEAVWVNGTWWMPPGAGEPEPHEHAPYAPDPESG